MVSVAIHNIQISHQHLTVAFAILNSHIKPNVEIICIYLHI